MGVKLVTSTTSAEMRLCTSLVDERYGETTEIIEPWSAEVRHSFPSLPTLTLALEFTLALRFDVLNGVDVEDEVDFGVDIDT